MCIRDSPKPGCIRGEARIALDIRDIDAGFIGEVASVVERGGGEVEAPGPGGAKARPAERVGADVALQVQDI